MKMKEINCKFPLKVVKDKDNGKKGLGPLKTFVLELKKHESKTKEFLNKQMKIGKFISK